MKKLAILIVVFVSSGCKVSVSQVPVMNYGKHWFAIDTVDRAEMSLRRLSHVVYERRMTAAFHASTNSWDSGKTEIRYYYRPDGSILMRHYDSSKAYDSILYDPYDRLTYRTYSDGTKTTTRTTITYDDEHGIATNHTIGDLFYDKSSKGWIWKPTQRLTVYEYTNGLRLSSNETSDGHRRETFDYKYDSQGRLIEVEHHLYEKSGNEFNCCDSSDVGSHRIVRSYDPSGLSYIDTSLIDLDTRWAVTRIDSCDTKHRIVRRYLDAGRFLDNLEYDMFGRKTFEQSQTTITSASYDERGLKIHSETVGADGHAFVTDSTYYEFSK